jgi:hypothetical protein
MAKKLEIVSIVRTPGSDVAIYLQDVPIPTVWDEETFFVEAARLRTAVLADRADAGDRDRWTAFREAMQDWEADLLDQTLARAFADAALILDNPGPIL